MPEIRSVSVRLDADVASYIAKMQAAGRATDQAFSSGQRNISETNTALSGTERELGKVDAQARRVDTSMSRVDTTMRRTADNGLAKATSNLDGFVEKLGVVPALAVAGTSALIPLGAAAVGVTAALGAPIAFVGGGLTLFGLLDGAAISQTNKQLTAIDALQKRLAGLQRGTVAYTTVAHQLKAAQDALTPAQRDYATSLDHLHTSFDQFLGGKTGQQLLEPVAQTLDLASTLLPKTEPIIRAVSGDLSQLLGELGKYAETPGFDHFIHQMASQVGPDLLAFGHIAGDVGPGIGRLLVLLGKRLSPELLHDLERLGSNFSTWASSRGARQDVEGFIRYLHQVGPEAGHAIEAVARGLDHTVHALAPLGGPALHGIQGIADAFNSIPTPVLTGIAGAAVALTAMSKANKGLNAFNELVGGGGSRGLGGEAGQLLGGRGVVPVYVTNWGAGGPGIPGVPGSGGGPKVPPVIPTLTRLPGKYGPLVDGALLATAVQGTLKDVDIFRRSSVNPNPADASALASSSLGKANGLTTVDGQTLHIDFARLSQSLDRFGASSPYALALQKRLQNGLGLPGPGKFSAAGHGIFGLGGNDQGDASNALRALQQAMGEAQKSLPAHLTSTTTGLDALNHRLSKTSQGLELVGHSSDRAFNGSAKDVDHLAGRVESLSHIASTPGDAMQASAAKASRSLDLVGHSAATNFQHAGSDAQHFQGQVDGLHGKAVNVSVTGAQQGIGQARALASALNALHDRTIRITTERFTGGHSVAGNADGGMIGGPRHPYGDKVLSWLAPGEQVISNRYGQADRFRADVASGRIPAYADGGRVTADRNDLVLAAGGPTWSSRPAQPLVAA